jgi:carbonic anhydrase
VTPAAAHAPRCPGVFDDLLDANGRYRAEHHDPKVGGRAARGLAVLTCIDSRIDPLAMLGLRAGDAKIVRNAGARVTEDALRSLILATNLLAVTRICVVQHTDCALGGSTEGELQARVAAAGGVDASGWEFLAMTDQEATLVEDLARIRACELIPPEVVLGGFVFDVRTGALTPVDTA